MRTIEITQNEQVKRAKEQNILEQKRKNGQATILHKLRPICSQKLLHTFFESK